MTQQEPDRVFIDNLGQRWEWCGGEDDTWAWRITANPLALFEEIGYALGDDTPEDEQPDAWFSACDIRDSAELADKLDDGRKLFRRVTSHWTPRLVDRRQEPKEDTE